MSPICEKIKKCIRHVNLVDERSGKRIVVSSGTGSVIRDDGLILTAAHVLMEDCERPYLGRILISHPEVGEVEYESLFPTALKLNIEPAEYIKPIVIDLMLIKPITPLSKSIDFLSLSTNLGDLGDDVVLAGYPDDTDLPFKFLDNINYTNPSLGMSLGDIEAMRNVFRLPLMKRAMIGLVSEIILNDLKPDITGTKIPESINLHGAIYWLDNHLTYGGSGGPIVNKDGDLIGVITEKSFTADKEKGVPKSVPSGTGMAYSHNLITWILPYV